MCTTCFVVRAITTVNMIPASRVAFPSNQSKETDMKKSVMITAAALLVMGASGAYAQSPHHRWTHARERMAPHANAMAFAPGGGYH
jgi:NADH:ubiquinone oxidoreductase subunit 5 (subunit L)/multisubunit Na+/H+ antiporter MnhA subunit